MFPCCLANISINVMFYLRHIVYRAPIDMYGSVLFWLHHSTKIKFFFIDFCCWFLCCVREWIIISCECTNVRRKTDKKILLSPFISNMYGKMYSHSCWTCNYWHDYSFKLRFSIKRKITICDKCLTNCFINLSLNDADGSVADLSYSNITTYITMCGWY